MKTLRNVKVLVAALLFVVALGTAGFHYLEGWPWFDGFYMVITTLTTIGYQEVHPLSHTGAFSTFSLFCPAFPSCFCRSDRSPRLC